MRIVIQTPYGKYYGKASEYSEKVYEHAYGAIRDTYNAQYFSLQTDEDGTVVFFLPTVLQNSVITIEVYKA
ncbi:hypothetical protein EB118_08285 [bacterium]|nr:hypothetical protein [bacterium]NDG30064.1 hypothetical protein [bacterium]